MKIDNNLIKYFLLSIAKGLHHVAYRILSYLDAQSLCRAELVIRPFALFIILTLSTLGMFRLVSCNIGWNVMEETHFMES